MAAFSGTERKKFILKPLNASVPEESVESSGTDYIKTVTICEMKRGRDLQEGSEP